MIILLKYIFIITILNSQETFIDSAQIKNPSLSWKLSFLPGLGQIYNENLHKTFFINTVLSLAYIEMNMKDKSIDKRNTWAWWIIGIYTLNLVDSYVDAHLTSFPVKKNKIK